MVFAIFFDRLALKSFDYVEETLVFFHFMIACWSGVLVSSSSIVIIVTTGSNTHFSYRSPIAAHCRIADIRSALAPSPPVSNTNMSPPPTRGRHFFVIVHSSNVTPSPFLPSILQLTIPSPGQTPHHPQRLPQRPLLRHRSHRKRRPHCSYALAAPALSLSLIDVYMFDFLR